MILHLLELLLWQWKTPFFSLLVAVAAAAAAAAVAVAAVAAAAVAVVLMSSDINCYQIFQRYHSLNCHPFDSLRWSLKTENLREIPVHSPRRKQEKKQPALKG